MDLSSKKSAVSQMPASEVMATDIVTCPPDTPVAEAARRMHTARSSSIIIVEDGRAIGIWTEYDTLRQDLTQVGSLDEPIATVMSAPVQTISMETPLGEVAVLFQKQRFRHYLVVDADETPRGIVSRTDIVINHGVEWFMRMRTAGSAVHDRLLTGTPAMTLSQAAQMMRESHAEAMVIHDGEVWGILTERDIVRAIAERNPNIKAARIASKPLATVTEHESLFHARNLMLERKFRHMGVTNLNGELIGLIGFGDILDTIEHGYIDQLESALRDRETELRESEGRYQALVEYSPDAILVHRCGQLLFVNPAGARLLGCSDPAELTNCQLADLLCPDHETDNPKVTANRLHLLNPTPVDAPIHERIRRFDDKTIDVDIAAMEVLYEGVPASQLVIRDVSRRKRMEDELRRLATTDQLTGAYNRLHFETHLEQNMKTAQRYGTPMSIVLIDVDHFKAINDEHGHHVGDAILCQVVEAIRETIRDSDILARWGGEEFVVLAPGTDLDGAALLAEKLRASVAEASFPPIAALTLSAGIGQYQPDESADELFQRVDDATYAAKSGGRNRVELAQNAAPSALGMGLARIPPGPA